MVTVLESFIISLLSVTIKFYVIQWQLLIVSSKASRHRPEAVTVLLKLSIATKSHPSLSMILEINGEL